MLTAAIRGVAHPDSAARKDTSGDDEPRRVRAPSSTRDEPEPEEDEREPRAEEDAKTPAVRKRLKRGPCKFIEHMSAVDRRHGLGASDDEPDDVSDSEGDDAPDGGDIETGEEGEEPEDDWEKAEQEEEEGVGEGDEQDGENSQATVDDDDDDQALVHAFATWHERRRAEDEDEGEDKDVETAGEDGNDPEPRTPDDIDNKDGSELELAVSDQRGGDQCDGPGNDGLSRAVEVPVPATTRSSTGSRKPVLTTTQKAALEAVQRLGPRVPPKLLVSIEKYVCTGAKELLGYINHGAEATDRGPAVSRRDCQNNILQVVLVSAVEALVRRARRKVTNALSGHGASAYPHSVFVSTRTPPRAPHTTPAPRT